MYIYAFEKLEVWQLARRFTAEIYRLTRCFPEEERFGLTSQMRRSARSVAANIAEGSTRATGKDQGHFYTRPSAAPLKS